MASITQSPGEGHTIPTVRLEWQHLDELRSFLDRAEFCCGLSQDVQVTFKALIPGALKDRFKIELHSLFDDWDRYTLSLVIIDRDAGRRCDITELGAQVQRRGGRGDSFVISEFEGPGLQAFRNLEWGADYQIYFDSNSLTLTDQSGPGDRTLGAHAPTPR